MQYTVYVLVSYVTAKTCKRNCYCPRFVFPNSNVVAFFRHRDSPGDFSLILQDSGRGKETSCIFFNVLLTVHLDIIV